MINLHTKAKLGGGPSHSDTVPRYPKNERGDVDTLNGNIYIYI